MRRSLILLLLFSYSLPQQVCAGFNKELIPDYEITKNERDPTISEQKSIFVFSFKNIPLPANITGACNGLQKTIHTNAKGEYILPSVPGKYVFQLYYSPEFYEITTDSIEIQPGYRMEIQVNFQSSVEPAMSEKPVIYVYPPTTTPVHLQLELKGELGFTYPTYKDGWDVIADPNGTLHVENKTYSYLFWDGTTNLNMSQIKWNEGYIVQQADLLSFLEAKLLQMGLNSVESQDFITYWYPPMSKNNQNYIHFIFNEEYDQYAHLTVTPQPDHVLRIYMIWTDATDVHNIQLAEQTLPSFTRSGFSLVEWGGTHVNELPLLGL